MMMAPLLFEERILNGGRAGQLAGVGDDIAFSTLGLAGAQHQDAGFETLFESKTLLIVVD